MAQFATVAAVTGNGTVFAVNAQGGVRTLKVGDVLERGETVRTVGDVRVELLMEDGRLLAVAPSQSVRLDEQVVQSEQLPTARDSAVTAPAMIDSVIQALERGGDLNQELEATAAGPGGGGGDDGGSSFVQLLRITENVDPLSYSYNFEALGPLEDLPRAPDQPPPAEQAATPNLVVTADTLVFEGSPGITYTATLDQPGTSDVTVTLTNGAVIVIPAGSTTGSVLVPVQGDDVYVDGETVQATVDTVQGGGFTAIAVDQTNLITVIADTIDTVSVKVSIAAEGPVTEAEPANFRVFINTVLDRDLAVTLSDGTIVVIPAGELSVLHAVAPQGDDVLKDPGTVTLSVLAASAGATNFENLQLSPDAATADIVDTIDEVRATLTADRTSIDETGGTIRYTVTLSNADGMSVTGHNGVTFTLANGSEVVIAAGQAAGFVDVVFTDADITDQPSLTNSITATVVASVDTASEFEKLVTTGNPVTDVDYGVGITNLTPQGQGGDAVVYEDDLPGGSDADKEPTTVAGSFNLTAPDGVASLVIAGHVVVSGGALVASPTFTTALGNTFTVTGYADGMVSYVYTLLDSEIHSSGQGTNDLFENLTIVLTDTDGDQATDTLSIRVVDDVPQAAGDAGGTVTEDGAVSSVSGNVLSNDAGGADAPKAFVGWGAGDGAAIAALNTYGTLSQNADGTWSYVLDNSRAATQALGEGFSQSYALTYTMADADGDQSTAQLSITIQGAADSARVVTAQAEGPDATVYERGLTSTGDTSESTSGSFTVSATDGIQSVVVGGTTLTLAQLNALGASNQAIDTGEGTLVLTGYDSATGAVSYTYTLAATIDNDSKAGATGTGFDDSVTITVNGVGGSSASDALVIRIVDDVPSVTAAVVGDGAITLTTQDAQTIGAATDTASASFAAAFLAAAQPVYGADGAGTTVISGYTLVVNNTASGLTSNGLAITLATDTNGDVVGSTEAGEVFRISVDASGTVTLRQSAELDHLPEDIDAVNDNTHIALGNGLVTLSATATVTDGDNDTATTTVSADLGGNIGFDDDVPSVTAAVLTGTVDEDGVPGGIAGGTGDVPGEATVATGSVTPLFNAGADAPLVYGLASNTVSTLTALGLTSGGVALSYSVSGDTVTALAGTTTVFTFQVTSGGTYTFSLYDQIDHPTLNGLPGDNTENDLLLGALVAATDADGDMVTASAGSLVITIDDDTPTDISPVSAWINNAAGSTATYALDIDGNVDDNTGADELGSVTFTVLDGTNSGLTSGGAVIYLYVSGDGKTLTGSTASTEGGVVSGNTVFTIQINQDGSYSSSTDTYTVSMVGTIDNGSGITFNDLSGGEAGNPPFKIIESTSADALELLFTPINGSSINSDVDDAAVDTQFIDIGGVGLRVDFGAFTFLPNGPGPADNSFSIDSHTTVNGFGFKIDQISEGTVADVWLKAYDADQDNTLTEDPLVTINKVQIYNAAGMLVGEFTADGASGGVAVDFLVDGTVQIDGLQAQYSVVTYTATGYDRIEVINDGTASTKTAPSDDGKFSISTLKIASVDLGNPVEASFQIQLTDADGDSVTSSLDVTFEPASLAGNDTRAGTSSGDIIYGGAGDDNLSGLGGNDVLDGGSGNDTLLGGTGNDTLTGGAGVDVFKWNLGDQGSTATPAADVIKDFTLGTGGDVLDLRDLLQGEIAGVDGTAATSLSQYLHFSEVGGKAVLSVDHDAGSFAATQTITFDNMSLTALRTALGAGTSDTDIIQKLLDNGNLKNTP